MNPKKEVKRLRQTNHHLEAENNKLASEVACLEGLIYSLESRMRLFEEVSEAMICSPHGFELRSLGANYPQRSRVIQMRIEDFVSNYEIHDCHLWDGHSAGRLVQLYHFLQEEMKRRGYQPGDRDRIAREECEARRKALF